MKTFHQIAGSICAPHGFKTAAVFCDIKRLGTGKGSEKGRKDDLALVVSDVPAAVAGMFTTNQMRAAPVRVSAKRATRSLARAIVVNSGNANACTGKRGLRDAEEMCVLAADALSTAASGANGRSSQPAVTDRRHRISADEVLVCSTGRIGMPLPMTNVARGIRNCASLLASTVRNAKATADAIMTSDTRRKEIAVEFRIGKSAARIGGICKGAGMIEPKMTRSGAAHATMLAFITSDVAIAPRLLKRALETAVGQSFNRISVDGDMSTNDSVIALANGAAKNSKITSAKTTAFGNFQAALNFVTLELAKKIVRDGEGVTRFVTLHVNAARSEREADAVARAIANSALVKTSWHGGDPNWGRILCAIGYSNARVDESRVDIGYGNPDRRKIVFAFRHGKPTTVPVLRLARVVNGPEFDVHISLNQGSGRATFYASDLTEDYVAFNKGDISDPASLGG
ncbi:MAG TPA: bifunctional glutamate N-acetyltransferase/amino-acid acetyltransferase ArgJ [Chthoniobacterales bacterium]